MIQIALIFATTVLSQTKSSDAEFVGDETRLVRLKADPPAYVGKTITICGGIRIHDYYNYSYRGRERSHYSLAFEESGDSPRKLGGDDCHLYLLRKYGGSIVETLAKFAEEKGNSTALKLARVKVKLLPEYYGTKQWDMLEVVDVQFFDKQKSEWQPWIVEPILAEEQRLEKVKSDHQKSQQEKAAKEQEKAAKEAASQRDEARQKADKAKADAEAAQWRTWTETGGKPFEAKFSGAVGGSVRLTRRDGSIVKIELKNLSKSDQDWLEGRKRGK